MEGLKRRWKKEDFLCLSLSTTAAATMKLPFLWRNHQVRKMSSPIVTVKPVARKRKTSARGKRKIKTKATGEAHIHFAVPPNVYSYVRKIESGFPCPFCRCKTYTENGLWTHLMTSKGAHLSLVPNRDNAGTLHVAIKNRDPQADLQIQNSPTYLAGETEVVFLRKFNWLGKRYKRNGEVLVFHQPSVELPTRNDGYENEEFVDDRPAWSEEAVVPVLEPVSDTEKSVPLSDYYLYNEYMTLSDALHSQKDNDPPPERQYFHVCNRQPISMGEWMLCSDSHGFPASREWRQLVLEERASAGYSDTKKSEKQFISRWNAVVKKNASSEEFSVTRISGQVLQRFGARRMPEEVWMGHLCNLWDTKQICKADMQRLMMEYHGQNMAQVALLGSTDGKIED